MKTKNSCQLRNWLLVGMLLMGGPAWAQVVQTNWLWQFGASTYVWSGTRVALSPDATLALTAHGVNGIKLWSAENGALLRAIAENPISFCVAFSPDGKSMFTGYGWGTFTNDQWSLTYADKLWSVADGTLVFNLSVNSNACAQSVAFSPDGTQMLMSREDKAYLWSLKDGSVLRTIEGTGGPVAFSADGTRALVGNKLWSAHDWALIRSFTLNTPIIALSPDGKKLLTGGQDWMDTCARLWSAEDGSLIRTLCKPTLGQTTGGAFSPDGTMVLTGGRFDTARLWSVSDGVLLRTLSCNMGDDAAFSRDGTKLLIGMPEGPAILWDIGQQKRRAPTIVTNPVSQTNFVGNAVRFEVSAAGSEPLAYQWRKDGANRVGATNAALTLFPLALSDAGSYTVAITNDQGSVTSVPVRLICRPLEPEPLPTNWVRRFSFGTLWGAVYSPKGDAILTYGSLGAYLWSTNQGPPLRQFPGVGPATFSPDGTKVLVGGSDGSVKLWSAEKGTVLRAFPANTRYPTPTFSADGTKALIGGELWSVTDGMALPKLVEGAAAISPDGASVLAINGYPAVSGGRILRRAELYSVIDGKYLGCVEGCGRYGLEYIEGGYSPDGSIFTWSGIDGVTLIRGNGSAVRLAGAMPLVAFSADGYKVLTMAWDSKTMSVGNNVKLWSATDGKLLRTFTGPWNSINSVALSPDGATVLLATDQRTVNLLSAEDGKLLRTSSWHSSPIRGVAFSPEGTRLLTGGDDSTVNLWSAGDGTLLRAFAGQSNQVLSVAFSPDGTRVLTGGGYPENSATLWSAEDGTVLRTFAESEGLVAFSADGSKALTGSKLWSVRDWTLLRTFQDGVMALSPDGTRVLTGAMLWSAEDGTLLRVFVGHSDWVTSAAFSPDGTKVLTGSDDKTAKLWSAGDGTLLRSFAGHSDGVSSVAVSPDATQVLTGSDDNTARLWSTADGSLLRTLEGHTAEVSSVAFSPDGTQALTGSLDGTALLWNIAAAQPGAPKILSGVMLSPNGPFQIRLQGETSVAYRLEGSTNLLNWTSLFTTNLTTDVWEWLDPQSPPLSQRFYRAVLP